MPVFRMTQEINRPVMEVFDTVIHVENFPAWSPQNPSARRVSSGPIGEGSRFVMEIKGFGHVPQELQEFETNRRVRIVPDIPQLAGGHRFKFTDLGGRTRVDHEMEMNPQGLLPADGANDVVHWPAEPSDHGRRLETPPGVGSLVRIVFRLTNGRRLRD